MADFIRWTSALMELYDSNCNLWIDRIDFILDSPGIGNLAKVEEDNMHIIANCG